MARKEKLVFDPEKQVDFGKLVAALDWTHEINPVILVQTVNKTAGLRGRHKYETNEVSFRKLMGSFESRVSEFVDIRIQGKDRFYRIKPGINPGDIIEKLGGKKPETKKEEEKKEVPSETPPKVKKDFPDSEALMKTACLLKFFQVYGKTLEPGTCGFREFIEKEGSWKKQRSIEGKKYTLYQETQKVLIDFLYLPKSSLVVGKKKVTLEITEPLERLIKDVSSLIEEPSEIKKLDVLLEKIKKPEPPKPKPVAIKPTITPTQPKVGLGKISGGGLAAATATVTKKVGTSKPGTENPILRWKKSVILDELELLKLGESVTYENLRANLKTYRFLELWEDELQDLVFQLETTQPGTFRMSGGTVSLRNPSGLQTLGKEYDSKKLTDEIYIRIKMSKETLGKMYPDLDIQIASGITEEDNIYRIVVSRFVDSERALTKLIWSLRPGEVILEPSSNWTIRRINMIIDKLGLKSVY